LKPHDITTSKGTITLRNSPSNAIYYDVSYINRVPADIKIDGAFADWENRDIEDDGKGEVNNNNLDIIEFSIINSTNTVSFYLRVDGELGWGTAVPYWNDGIAGNDSEPTEPVEPGPPSPSGPSIPPNKGEDVTYIYVDSDNLSTTGYLLHGIGADQLIEIKAKYGEILSKKHLSFAGSSPFDWDWIHVTNVEVGKDTARLETQISKSDLGITGGFQVYFQTTDWSGTGGDWSHDSITRGYPRLTLRGTRGSPTVLTAYPTGSTPTIDGALTTGTEWDDADLYTTGNIDVWVMQDGTWLYIMVKRNDDGTVAAGDYCDIMFETDDKGDNYLEDGEDVKWRSEDTTGTDILTDYGVNGGVWDDGAFTGQAGQDSASSLDPGDSDITYEFKIAISDVFGASPQYDKTVGFAVYVWNDDTSSGDWWPDSGSPSETDPSTWGDLSLPEFQEILIPSFMLIALFMVFKRKTKIKKRKVQQ
jgi:hypothetical protein